MRQHPREVAQSSDNNNGYHINTNIYNQFNMVKRQLAQAQKDKITKFVLYPLVGLIGADDCRGQYYPQGDNRNRYR